MASVRSPKWLWMVGGMGLLAAALLGAYWVTHPPRKMISIERVHEIFSGRGAPMTADDFFDWIELLRQKRPLSLEAVEKILGVRLRRLTPKEEFIRKRGIEELKRQGPLMEKGMDEDAKVKEVGVVEWPSGPWKEIVCDYHRNFETLWIRFVLRPEVLPIRKSAMLHHLGRFPGVLWDSSPISVKDGKLYYPQGITAKNPCFVYEREKDEVELYFGDPELREVTFPRPLVSGYLGISAMPFAK
ncbi:hypothetical protein [Methylacidimicrobium sp. B4]|uniref:hypothetical protein n=1 Tax=Methylacidimicrobium sp. B4 TaxID=2796139 RepID=UPI001A8DC1A2|nr:hypothetical protein [Methylacidimicrobium sp. B4]QSR84557.1 hypothetical protein MacB4_10225 [Methylacidimicrobium sp. B4]